VVGVSFGALILFKSQFSALEFLIRNMTDAANTVSPRAGGQPRSCSRMWCSSASSSSTLFL
jgi:hypothetical protein